MKREGFDAWVGSPLYPHGPKVMYIGELPVLKLGGRRDSSPSPPPQNHGATIPVMASPLSPFPTHHHHPGKRQMAEMLLLSPNQPCSKEEQYCCRRRRHHPPPKFYPKQKNEWQSCCHLSSSFFTPSAQG